MAARHDRRAAFLMELTLQTLDAPPPWRVSEWFNTATPIHLNALKGRVVMLEAFQMLCPGCALHGLPQAQRVRSAFREEDVAVIGLHTVFEHHAAMTPVSLKAFLHEYRITFPVGVDEADPKGAIPQTMAVYGMRGTPSMLIFDRAGKLRQHKLGQVEDLVLGATLANLISEPLPGDAPT